MTARTAACGALLALVLGTAAHAAHARTIGVPAARGAAAAAVATAAPGDTVVLASGIHAGALVVRAALVLRGAPGAVLDGRGRGTVLTVAANGAVVEDLTIRGSGARVMDVDAGVHVLTARGVTLRRLVLDNVLYGIYGERCSALTIDECRLAGRVRPGDEGGEGNGVHLWYCDGVRLHRTRVERFLDTVYLSFANHIDITRCTLTHAGRYGLHTMYCQDNRLLRSTFAHNVAGCAIMFSNHLVVRGNDFAWNRGPRTYGLLLRDCSDGLFVENRIVDNTIGVFMDGSNRNRFAQNLVENNGWGILLFSSCAGNQFARNAFVNDDYPVALDMKYTDNVFDDGRAGNYWSANAAYDLDGNGVSDAPYTPVSTFAFLSKQYPDLTVLAKSPAVAALGVAERVLPALRPSEAVDRFPLVAPPRMVRPVDAMATTVSAETARPAIDWRAACVFACVLTSGLAGLAARMKRLVRRLRREGARA